MSNNEWVQEGTPREPDWSAEQDDYGVPVSPAADWDDYAEEQAVPVPEPPAPVLDDAEPVAEEPADEPEAEQPADEPADAPEPEPDVEATQVRPRPVADAVVPPELADPTAQQASPAQPEPLPEAVEAPAGDVEPAVDEAPAEEAPAEEAPAEEGPAEEPVDEAPAQEAAAEEEPVAADADEEQPAEDADDEPTKLTGVADEPAAETTAMGAAALAGLYRPEGEETQIIDAPQRRSLEEEVAEEERLAQQLREEKEARDQRLGLVATSEANALREPAPAPRRGVGGFGSFGLLVLRLVVAGLLGIVGYQILTDIDATAALLGRTMLPEPRLVAWILGFALAAMAVFLVLGMAVRVVGLLLTAIAVGSLVFIRWGNFSIFTEGVEGFIGDKDLLLAAVGVLLLSLGGGKVGVDGAISSARHNAREAKRS